ncbi:MAG: tetratricopeptide repeat protein, partial [Elusimicrobia bacterium]|nr:tetratricopeptide repeat protein [Elusimicrobiota bacterium]
AEIYFKTSDYLRAKNKIRDTLMIEPNCLPARLMLSETLYERGEFKEAFEQILYIEKIIGNSKIIKFSNYNRALLRFNMGNYNSLRKRLWKMKTNGKIIV